MENPQNATRPLRPSEVVGTFPNYKSLQFAIDDLQLAAFASCERSLVGKQEGEQADELVLKLADDPKAGRTDHYCSEAP